MEGYFSIAIGIIDLENDQKKKRKKSEMMIWFGLVVKEGGGYEQVAEPRMLRYT